MKGKAIASSDLNFIVCKYDSAPMVYTESGMANVGILKCTVCREQYVIVNNIILTDYNLMSDEDRKIVDQLTGMKKTEGK